MRPRSARVSGRSSSRSRDSTTASGLASARVHGRFLFEFAEEVRFLVGPGAPKSSCWPAGAGAACGRAAAVRRPAGVAAGWASGCGAACGCCLALRCLVLRCLARWRFALRGAEPGTLPDRHALLVRRGRCPGADVRRLVELVPRMAPHPLEGVLAAHERLVDFLEEVHVQHRLAVGLAPALALPAGHPLGHGVDDVLAVAEDQQVFPGHVRRCPEQVQHRHQFALVVRAVGPSAGPPAVVIHVPGPAGRAGIS